MKKIINILFANCIWIVIGIIILFVNRDIRWFLLYLLLVFFYVIESIAIKMDRKFRGYHILQIHILRQIMYKTNIPEGEIFKKYDLDGGYSMFDKTD